MSSSMRRADVVSMPGTRPSTEDATWRRVMERTAAFLDDQRDVIHPAYLEGWRALDLPLDRVPHLDEVNGRLAPVGWRTQHVDGYLPAYEYAGLLANRIFPVARILRRPEHVDYSPIPDMAHDLIGHLPMLFSDEHGAYLRALAKAMARAEPNVLDHELYEANRDLALLRTRGLVTPDLERAEARAAAAGARLSAHPSELTHLGRLYLWTVEFGLLGGPDQFAIYGSALLSAPRECRALLADRGAIHPYTLDAIHHDIAFCDLQARYYVAPDHARLREVLAELEARRAR